MSVGNHTGTGTDVTQLSLRLAQSRHRDCAGLAADSASLSGRRRRRGSAAWQRRWRQPRLGL